MSEQWLNLPSELRERKQWVVCVKGEKIPRVPISGYPKASSTDPSTWRPFNQCARAALDDSRLVLGYVLAADDPFSCIDFDVHDDTTEQHLTGYRKLIMDLNSYTETSISERGVHVWVRGKIGNGRRHSGVEIYSQERFILSTGNAVAGYPATIQDRQCALDWMVARMDGASVGSAYHIAELVELAPRVSDGEILDRLSWHEKAPIIRQLWDGKWAELGYPSASEADMALIAYIANSTMSNEQVRRIFRQTQLAHCDRGKNTGKHMRSDYHLNKCLERVRGQQQHNASVFSASPAGQTMLAFVQQHDQQVAKQKQEREYLDSLIGRTT